MNAEKYETWPRTFKMTNFGETLYLLKSANTWDKFSLTRFEVKFSRTKTKLSSVVSLRMVKTNKRKDERYGIWSKQRCAFSFEVPYVALPLTHNRQYRWGDNAEELRDRICGRACGSQSRVNITRDAWNGLSSRVLP